ncbi:MAG: thioredoxin family protein, partial [Planctomycetales bacterium]|nr:thioredoxin family protein [Planctomycetales bacterium]
SSASSPPTLGFALVLAFFGGIVLNVMPCVLPVIGLKIFSFVEQSGKHRMKNLLLNVSYAAGVTGVFLILAMLAVVFRLGWGQLFQYSEFNIAMAAVIFVMGLSFIGVWEIPIPGFVGSPGVSQLEQREGYEGAFVKGMITTLLATPCTGPLMGTALVGVLDRPAIEIIAIFLLMGLGMSSPYLLIGAFPELVKFLPKPGAWMNTFKQVMGFVLVGTVVYLLTLLKPYYVVPTVALLFSLWWACWMIGSLPLTAPSDRKMVVWSASIGITAALGAAAFGWLAPTMHERLEDVIAKRVDAEVTEKLLASGGEFAIENVPWQPYSETKLAWLLDHGHTVVIDFTADWCPNCKVNEARVLHTEETVGRLKALGVYTLVADWTHRDEAKEVTAKLRELKASGIPLVAIYSPAAPDRPTLIDGLLQQGDLLEKVQIAAQMAGENTARVVRRSQPGAE